MYGEGIGIAANRFDEERQEPHRLRLRLHLVCPRSAEYTARKFLTLTTTIKDARRKKSHLLHIISPPCNGLKKSEKYCII